MRITFITDVDQDLGLEAMHAASGSTDPIDVFAQKLVQDFLINLKPIVDRQQRVRLQRAIDTAAQDRLDAAEQALIP